MRQARHLVGGKARAQVEEPRHPGEHHVGDEEDRQRRAEAEIEAIALAALRAKLGDVRRGTPLLSGLAKRVVVGELDPHRAADELIAELGA